jgi:uncharacterized membrane protein
MNILRTISQRRLAVPLIALFVTSAFAGTLVVTRILWTGRLTSVYLIWNLFLAWLPLLFALKACGQEPGKTRPWKLAAWAAGWLLFFPNAPYIFTDLIHLTARHRATVWTDLVLIALFAVTGLVLGFLSLYLMQSLVVRRMGRVAGWLFVGVSAGLGSLGIYVGRFLRWNSWDPLINPFDFTRDVGEWLVQMLAHRREALFPALFAAFLFLAYAMLYALTHLNPVAPGPLNPESREDFS